MHGFPSLRILNSYHGPQSSCGLGVHTSPPPLTSVCLSHSLCSSQTVVHLASQISQAFSHSWPFMIIVVFVCNATFPRMLSDYSIENFLLCSLADSPPCQFSFIKITINNNYFILLHVLHMPLSSNYMPKNMLGTIDQMESKEFVENGSGRKRE